MAEEDLVMSLLLRVILILTQFLQFEPENILCYET